MKKPTFFIVGAPKCGTTALATFLSEHEQVFMADPKEPLYFMHPDAEDRKIVDEAHYLSLFKNARHESAVGEASVWYLYSSHARRRIRAFNPTARIIVMQRNPVDFVASLHSQLVFSGEERAGGLEQAWLANKHRFNRKPTIEQNSDWKTMYAELLDIERYAQAYIRDFGRKNVLVLSQEAMSRDPRECYRAALAFIGVDDDGRSEFQRININKRHKSQWVRWLMHASLRQRGMVSAARHLKAKMGFGTLGIYKLLEEVNTESAPRPPVPNRVKAEIAKWARERPGAG